MFLRQPALGKKTNPSSPSAIAPRPVFFTSPHTTNSSDDTYDPESAIYITGSSPTIAPASAAMISARNPESSMSVASSLVRRIPFRFCGLDEKRRDSTEHSVGGFDCAVCVVRIECQLKPE